MNSTEIMNAPRVRKVMSSEPINEADAQGLLSNFLATERSAAGGDEVLTRLEAVCQSLHVKEDRKLDLQISQSRVRSMPSNGDDGPPPPSMVDEPASSVTGQSKKKRKKAEKEAKKAAKKERKEKRKRRSSSDDPEEASRKSRS